MTNLKFILSFLLLFPIGRCLSQSNIATMLTIESTKINQVDQLLYSLDIINRRDSSIKFEVSVDESSVFIAEFRKSNLENWERILINEHSSSHTPIYDSPARLISLSKSSSKRYSFSSLLKFFEPGKYHLRVRFRTIEGKEIVSSEQKFKVVALKGVNKRAFDYLSSLSKPYFIFDTELVLNRRFESEEYVKYFINNFSNSDLINWAKLYYGRYLLNGTRRRKGPLFVPHYTKVLQLVKEVQFSKRSNRLIKRKTKELLEMVEFTKNDIEGFQKLEKMKKN